MKKKPLVAPADDITEEITPEESAFTGSDNHALGELELQPYTPQRIVAANRIGVVFPNIGDDAIEQFAETGVYPGALQDTLIVLWLCTLETPEEVRRAMRRPDESLDKAIEWGAERGITNVKSPEFWKALTKFIEITREPRQVASVPAKEADSGGNP